MLSGEKTFGKDYKMSVEIEEKACPYCGQLIICGPDVDPRRRCRCADAVRYSASAETLEDMETALEERFGDNCAETDKSFVPCAENEFSGLHHAVVLVAAGLFEKASITLQDGSVCAIKKDSVQRKLTIKR